MKNTQSNNSLIQLSNGKSVQSDFLDYIQYAVIKRLPVLSPHTSFTLKQICGDDFWSDLTSGEQKRAGSCMVHFVAKGELPFKTAKGKGDNHKQYQLK